MNDDGLDARLRRHFAGLDTVPGFEARVLEAIAALPAVRAPDLRAGYEARRLAERTRLRREAWLNAATAVGAGVAALALVWQRSPEIAAWIQGGLEAVSGSGDFMLAALALLAAGLWPLLQRFVAR